MMLNYSEREMSEAFELALTDSSIRGIPSFKLLQKEFACHQGVPDFIGLPTIHFIENYSFSDISSVDGASLVLSLLKYNSGRRWAYLKRHTALSDTTLNQILKELTAQNYIEKKDDLYYRSNFFETNDKIWAFELKLSNWKRALFQALQYKAFANYVVVVLPLEKEELLRQNILRFHDMNVGVLLFDTNSGSSKWLNRPQKEQPVSKWQNLLLFCKLAQQETVR